MALSSFLNPRSVCNDQDIEALKLSKFGRTLTMKFSHKIVSLFALSFALISCLPNDDFPIEPRLVYKGLSLTDTVDGFTPLGYAHLRFTDGDGNIGMNEDEQFQYDTVMNRNLFVIPYKKIDGEFILAEVAITNHVQIKPRLSNSEDPLEGDIDVGLSLPSKTFQDTGQTVILRWEIFLVDRDKNKSNVITTEEYEFPWP